MGLQPPWACPVVDNVTEGGKGNRKERQKSGGRQRREKETEMGEMGWVGARREKTGAERGVWTGGHTPGPVTGMDRETAGEEAASRKNRRYGKEQTEEMEREEKIQKEEGENKQESAGEEGGRQAGREKGERPRPEACWASVAPLARSSAQPPPALQGRAHCTRCLRGQRGGEHSPWG